MVTLAQSAFVVHKNSSFQLVNYRLFFLITKPLATKLHNT